MTSVTHEKSNEKLVKKKKKKEKKKKKKSVIDHRPESRWNIPHHFSFLHIIAILHSSSRNFQVRELSITRKYRH